MPCLGLPNLDGAIPGGDQNGFSSYQHYNDFDLLGTAAEDGYRSVLAKYHNISNFTITAFSVMQVSTIQVRGMVLGGMQSTPPASASPTVDQVPELPARHHPTELAGAWWRLARPHTLVPRQPLLAGAAAAHGGERRAVLTLLRAVELRGHHGGASHSGKVVSTRP